MSTLIIDFAGAPYDGKTAREQPIGGSELANVQLAEALADHGHKVHILVARDQNKEFREINGVGYGHALPDRPKNLILSRMTPLPRAFFGLNKIVSLTDMGPHRIADCEYLVGVSRWQLDRFKLECLPAKRRCIPPIVEKAPDVGKVPGRYVYASAAMKGLKETLAAWAELRPRLPANAHLRVSWGGWGAPDFEVTGPDVEVVGALAPADSREEIASAIGLFYVNTYPETFCAIAAVAEAAKTTPYIWCPGGDPAGLGESITTPWHSSKDRFFEHVLTGSTAAKSALFMPKNYSKNKIVQAWENILL